MTIHTMSREESLEVLARARLARLACVRENQPYIAPVFLAYAQLPGGTPALYGFTTAGQKIQWMRDNPRVCVEVDEVETHDEWVSVIALGRYEELHDHSKRDEMLLTDNVFQHGRYVGPDEPDDDDPRLLAHQVLNAHAVWWEPAGAACVARTQGAAADPLAPVYYRILVDEISGHRATPDPRRRLGPVADDAKASRVRQALEYVLGPLLSRLR
jgi:nitroimidazol reductase NimA-like FMN-containing flavoprotein (pyridoxamine 5'-phosphate oxidase superfamily)